MICKNIYKFSIIYIMWKNLLIYLKTEEIYYHLGFINSNDYYLILLFKSL